MFNDIIEQAKSMSVDERVELLEQSEELAQLHASAATEGQTEVRMFFMQRDKLLKNVNCRLLIRTILLISTLFALLR